MVFENYPKTMLHRRAPLEDILADMSEITTSISMGDVVETNIYTDQNWYLQNIHGFLTCAYTSYTINKYDYDGPENYQIDFSSDLNKTSLKNINKKSIGIIQSCFKKKKNLCDLLLHKQDSALLCPQKSYRSHAFPWKTIRPNTKDH